MHLLASSGVRNAMVPKQVACVKKHFMLVDGHSAYKFLVQVYTCWSVMAFIISFSSNFRLSLSWLRW